jgi:hypothetical protein
MLLTTLVPSAGRGHPPLPPVVGAAEVVFSDAVSGLAIGGRDPLTYFLPVGPKPGLPEHEVLWGGAAWRFVSAANREAFAANPLAFAPRLGGYDAEAVSRGLIVDSNPNIYVVRHERLYLFRNDANRARFLADEAVAARGEEAWPRLRIGLVAL